MKTKLLLITFLLTVGVSWGQEIKVGQNFYLKGSTYHSKTNLKNQNIYDTINRKLNYLEDNVKLKIEDINGDSIVVMANPSFKESYTKAKYYNDIRYTISKKDYDNKAEEIEKSDLPDRLSIGILTLPFKFRPQKSKSFDSDFNLNSTLACRFFSLGGGHLYGQIGAGIGGVELNEVNSKGITDEATIKANALSMLTGLMIQYKKVQAGIYLGTDFINNQPYYQWQYQGKSWFAFGIGYQIFNIGLGGAKKSNE